MRGAALDRPGWVAVDLEADKLELQAWGRAAALRRQEPPAWIKRSLNETAQADEQRKAPLARQD